MQLRFFNSNSDKCSHCRVSNVTRGNATPLVAKLVLFRLVAMHLGGLDPEKKENRQNSDKSPPSFQLLTWPHHGSIIEINPVT